MTAPALRDRLRASLSPTPAVRPQVITKDRQIVDTTGDVWRFRASDDGGRLLHIKWPVIAAASAPMFLSERAMQIIKLYIAHRLTSRSFPRPESDSCTRQHQRRCRSLPRSTERTTGSR